MDIRKAKIGFIGFGSMAGAICDGLLLKKVVDPSAVFACARDMDRLRRKCGERGIIRARMPKKSQRQAI